MRIVNLVKMKYFFLIYVHFLLALHYYQVGVAERVTDISHSFNHLAEPPYTTSSTTTTVTTTSSPDDYMDSISIQDVLLSDMDANERVEDKIISAIEEYSSNCFISKNIDLSLSEFSFPENSVTFELGAEYITFYNLRISESSYNENKRKLHSASIGCDSSKTSKVHIKLPKNIQIEADLKITRQLNSSKSFQSNIIDTGSISLSLKNISILKHFSIRTYIKTNYEDDITSKLYFSKFEVSLNFDEAFQMQIYSKLNDFYEKVELSIRQFLAEKLDMELVKNGITIINSCAKLINADKNLKKVNLPFFNNNLNNLYVISNVALEMWKGVSLSAGPIIIDGLTSFNSTELTVVESELSGPDGPTSDTTKYFYYTTPSYDDPERKEKTIRIKTNELKGKLDWSYNSRQKSFPFSIEFVRFEITKKKVFQFQSNYGQDMYDSSYGEHRYYPEGTYTRLNDDMPVVDVNLYLGNIYIKSSKSNSCENENEFVHFVLSEYLKTVIANSLKTSIVNKLQNKSIFVNCN